jgi:hypothetical protein
MAGGRDRGVPSCLHEDFRPRPPLAREAPVWRRWHKRIPAYPPGFVARVNAALDAWDWPGIVAEFNVTTLLLPRAVAAVARDRPQHLPAMPPRGSEASGRCRPP